MSAMFEMEITKDLNRLNQIMEEISKTLKALEEFLETCTIKPEN